MTHNRLRWALLAVTVGVAMGCDSPTEIIVAGYESLDPPAYWSQWFEDVRSCAAPDYPLSFERVRWYVADVVHYTPEDRGHFRSVSGLWIEPADVILKRDVIGSTGEAIIVRHEMVHLLTQTTDHLDPAFGCVMP